MPPLAHSFARQILDLKHTDANRRKHLRGLLEGVHFFEMTAVCPIVDELTRKIRELSLEERIEQAEADESKIFLPAPTTWFEKRCSDGEREALRLSEVDEKIIVQLVSKDAGVLEIGWLTKHLTKDDGYFINIKLCGIERTRAHFILISVAALLIIVNSPRIIGRRQVMPHAGLEREFLRKQKLVGKFPLHAYTEVVLNVSKPTKIDDGKIHEAHLTGQRPFHWVRAHLQRYCGIWTRVVFHHRGNVALGFKQKRYRLR